MSKNKIIIFLLFVITLLTISCSVAADINDDTSISTVITETTDNSDTNIGTLDNTKEISKTSSQEQQVKTDTTDSDDNSYKTSVKNYEELVKTFNEAKTSQYNEYIIDLEEGDYSITDSILFNDSFTHKIIINGNNQKFSSNNLTSIFLTICEGYELTLNNINFNDINYSSTYILIRNLGSLTMNNVDVTGLTPNIFIMGIDSNIVIENSTFHDNSLNLSLIFVTNSDVNIVNTKFINNTVATNDYTVSGLINSMSNSTIYLDNISAIDNNSTHGTIINGYSDTNIIVNNSFFKNNRGNVGGVISGAQINLVINNSEFIANNAKSVGGAIAIKRTNAETPQNSQLSIENSSFEENNGGTSGGGAIYAEDTAIKILESEFIDNSAYFGGAICHLGENLTIDSSSFYGNHANYDGGALFLMYIENGLINNTEFIDNYADEEGNVILVSFSDDVQITKTIIENNEKTENTDLIDIVGNTALNISYSSIIGPGEEIIDNEYNDNIVLNNNWWGENNPNFEELTEGIIPDNWYIVNKAYSLEGDKYLVSVNIDCDNKGNIINEFLPTRIVEFVSSTGSFDEDILELDELAYTYYFGDIDDAYAIVDNEIIKFNSKLTPYMSSVDENVIINSTVTLKLNVNPDISGNFELLINGKTLSNNLRQSNGQVTYTLPANYKVGNYTVTWTFSGNDKYEEHSINSTLTVLENKTVSTIITPLKTKPGILNVTNITEFPSRYDLRELGLVTPVKDQGADGVCWTFGTMSTLESNILKALNETYDLSENHIKNTLRKYSFVGDMDYPTDGGMYILSSGYLASLYGPVLEEFDPYDEDGTISPLTDEIVLIVRDTYYLSPRKDSLDNNEIKAALMNYGAVGTSMGVEDNCWSDETKTNHYNPDSHTDHAIAIVGWDDNYSRYNFKCTDLETGEILIPEGDGAFIIKNSWGTSVGEEGFMYVSYYDASIATTDIPMGLMVYVINNTEDYEGVYEFDTTANDEKDLNSSEVWIKNIFTVSQDHFIKAVGTVFLQDSEYTINIYRNGVLEYTQDGTVDDGYRTIKLNKYVSVEENDKLTVEVRIKTLDSSFVRLLVQDAKDYKRPIIEGVSFASADGVEWIDLIKDDTPSYAVLKAYGGDCEVPVTTTEIVSNDLTITTELNDTGNVTFKINGVVIGESALKNGMASISYNVENLTGDSIVISTIVTTEDNIFEQNVTIPLIKSNNSGNDTNNTNRSIPKKDYNSKDKTFLAKVSSGSNGRQFDVIVKDNVIYTGNVITLELLNNIFNESFINGHLLVYLDGKLVFNGTVDDDLSIIILQIIEDLIGDHELKVVFTNNKNQTNTFTENITIR